MFFKSSSRSREICVEISDWKNDETRSLGEAARLAMSQAKAESLPLLKANALSEIWFARTMLDTIPVHGVHASGGTPQAIGPGAAALQLSAAHDALIGETETGPVWHELAVKREDYDRYIEWLRSHW
jgi:hypothetical protein